MKEKEKENERKRGKERERGPKQAVREGDNETHRATRKLAH